MNGPEHYREAEKCLTQAASVDFDHAAYLHREAQVHATLALAAATISGGATTVTSIRSWDLVLEKPTIVNGDL